MEESQIQINLNLINNKQIITDAFNIYSNMVNNSDILNASSLCTFNDKQLPRTHFHASEFGMCYRKIFLNLITPRKNEDDKFKNIFLFDGHQLELSQRKLLETIGEISHVDEEFSVIKEVRIPNTDVIIPVNIVGHTDSILTYDNKQFVVEFKAVKNFSFKNFAKKGIISDQYYGQCQAYMLAHSIDYAILFYKHRETSEIAPPIIIERNNEYIAMRLIILASVLYSLQLQEIPPRQYVNKNCDACKFCDYKEICWKE